MNNFKDLYPNPNAGSGPKMDMAPFHEVFGDQTPHIEPTPIGRYRLVNALKGRFGDSYRSYPTAIKLLNHFDSQYDLMRRQRKIRGSQG
jgi:hypothetical protein